ncbi:putative LRR receptor-like serine/threonine-protein kinase [Vitis vinifera]|uniref:Putative LRR receptor-like serine/threonine-protein kinase n=1 Tax=Vitis vinifera TaxID=29760 RepID=A0A438D5R6_VITVI|nr:putative LRR receptor-like serine/threonine-protein kinase [Vitis vinifera]
MLSHIVQKERSGSGQANAETPMPTLFRNQSPEAFASNKDLLCYLTSLSPLGLMMKLCTLLLVSLLFVSAMGQLPSQDILALLEFKKGIKHDPTGYVLNSWNEESIDFNGCPSSWNGIVCNGVNVAGVVLDHQGLSADVDLSVFSNLTMLVKLSMSGNSISGKIPDNIGDLKSLEYLDLSDNLFFSSLPPGIGKLANLKNLSLAGNNFSGSIPDSILGLESIQSLDFSRNSFSGDMAASLTKLTNLVSLNLSLNGFESKIPKGFELLSKLEILDLHGNMLSGHLDEEFLRFSSAIHVDFSGNMLVNSGLQKQNFLSSISSTVMYLNLSHNQLMGSLVSGGGPLELANLKVLDLSYNQLSGELPGFNFLYALEVLKLSNNRFTGFIPNDLLKGDPLVLTELDLSANNLSGLINMITSTTLNILNLSSNGLSGELPLLTGSCTVLDLSSLPKVLTLYPKLRVLDLSSNQFDGLLLADLLTLPTLQELYLENNLFAGAIEFSPPSVNSSLKFLDLSQNHLNGYFPDQFGSLTALQRLNLAANNLSGSLPTSMSEMNSLSSLDISQNNFTGPLPNNFSNSLESFNASYNDLSGTVPENLRKFPSSSFFPGNSGLHLPGGPPGSTSSPSDFSKRKPIKTIIKVVIIVSCVVAVLIFILLAIFIHYIRLSRRSTQEHVTRKDIHKGAPQNPSGFNGRESGGALVVSAEDLLASRKGSSSEIISSDEKMAVVTGFSPSKTSHLSWSPESGDSFTAENLARLDVRSPDQLAGELHFLDDTITLTPEELSRAPAEVLGRSSHGTSYRATLENGVFLTVKWLREGVAKERKEFAKEAKKFANIRHPNVVGLRGYYWDLHNMRSSFFLIISHPETLQAFFMVTSCSSPISIGPINRPGRKGPPLTWAQRLKIAVDVARGLNYLHFDRAVPHGNLKATNILLDGPDLNARVADYCLHRLMTQAGTIEQILDAGCAGDVVSGEEGGVDLTDWVRLRVAEGRGLDCLDPAVAPEMGNPAAEKGVKEVLGIALRCIRSVSERPGIKTIYEDLSSI